MTNSADHLPPHPFRLRADCLVIVLGCALASLNFLWGLAPAWPWLPHVGIGLVFASSVYLLYKARSPFGPYAPSPTSHRVLAIVVAVIAPHALAN